MFRRSFILLILCGAGLLTACAQPPADPLDLAEGCNPLLAGADCFLPYPSDVFLLPDANMPSGQRVDIPAAAMVYNRHGESADVNTWKSVDGFSRTSPIVTMLDSTLAPDGLVSIFDDPTLSVRAGNSTLIIHAETGERVAHFVDLDPRTQEPERQALVLRPISGLEAETTYVIAIHAVNNSLGELVRAPEGFRRLRDGVAKWDAELEPLIERYEDSIFPMIEDAGVERESLQLAWEFTTASQAHVLDDVLRARELAMAAMQENPPRVEIDGYQDSDSGEGWRTISGTITAPAVIESANPGAPLLRDEHGRVKVDGEISFPFYARIPRSVRDSGVAGSVLQFGHGFFGSREEGIEGAVTHIANETRGVTFAIDWWGMCSTDVGVMAGGLSRHLNELLEVTDRMPQTMVNWLALTHALHTDLSQAEAFMHPETGDLLFDAEQVNFLGISMGAIFGGVYGALNPELDNIVLHVGGASFSNMMFRANPFGGLLFMLEMAVPDPLDQQKISAMLQTHLDRIDPASFAQYLLHEDLPFGPPSGRENKRVLVQIGLADTQVPNSASFLHGRLLGVPLLTPTPLDLWGYETVDGPITGSAMTIFDLGYDPSFALVANPPTDTTPIHNQLRHVDEAVSQMRALFDDGVIAHPCEYGCGNTSLLVE